MAEPSSNMFILWKSIEHYHKRSIRTRNADFISEKKKEGRGQKGKAEIEDYVSYTLETETHERMAIKS